MTCTRDTENATRTLSRPRAGAGGGPGDYADDPRSNQRSRGLPAPYLQVAGTLHTVL
jgi:hypothetical protein